MVRHYQILLESVIADPNQRISTLPILTDAERQLLVEWNNTRRSIPEQLYPRIVRGPGKQTPDSIAVTFEGTEITYQTTEGTKADQLAHYLRRLGVGPDNSLVGICLERSLEMMVGLLGILKAGSAYVPLDPAIRKSDCGSW